MLARLPGRVEYEPVTVEMSTFFAIEIVASRCFELVPQSLDSRGFSAKQRA
jgi:hypothetical protein